MTGSIDFAEPLELEPIIRAGISGNMCLNVKPTAPVSFLYSFPLAFANAFRELDDALREL